MKIIVTKFATLLSGLSLFMVLLMGLPLNVLANEEFISEQRSDFDTLSEEDIKNTRQKILTMEKETLERLYKKYPKIRDEIKKAYGYGVFDGHIVNLLIYVAGHGNGVVYDNKTKTPIFMNAIRAGTGPGLGYKSFQGVVIFANETVYKQFTTVGLQVSASGDATIKIAGIGAEAGKSASLVPGVSLYQLTDLGIVLQANWGATEFLKDPDLNK